MTPDVPKISVVMPLYNKEPYVRRAVQSVLDQSVPDFEIIIIDDGSTDRGLSIVKSISDPRIRVLSQENLGVSAARNCGINESRSDLIAFLDSDDEWERDFIETILRLRDNFPSCQVFATNYVYRRPGYVRPAIINGLPPSFKEGVLRDYFDIASRSDPVLFSSSVTVTKAALDSIGGFPAGISSGEDLLVWAKLAIKYQIAYCRLPKAVFWEPVSVASRPGRMPQKPDIVGSELKRLAEDDTAGKVEGLDRYIALWHKMRASIFLHLGCRNDVILEVLRSLKASYSYPIVYFYALIALMPRGIAKWIISRLHNIYLRLKSNEWNERIG